MSRHPDIAHLKDRRAAEHLQVNRAWCSKQLTPSFGYLEQDAIAVCERELKEQPGSSGNCGLRQSSNFRAKAWKPKDNWQLLVRLNHQHAFEAFEAFEAMEATEATEAKFSVPGPQSRGLRWRLKPNPSFNRSTNGRPPSPGRWYAVHFHRPGLGALPLAPG